ncbi:MAG: hypothetical protein KC652_05380 [Cyanobacteria bacterium HKST-UBA01]|nr:hypothetical protein [Cyanobacteria bacterium HKST-UBA01]
MKQFDLLVPLQKSLRAKAGKMLEQYFDSSEKYRYCSNIPVVYQDYSSFPLRFMFMNRILQAVVALLLSTGLALICGSIAAASSSDLFWIAGSMDVSKKASLCMRKGKLLVVQSQRPFLTKVDIRRKKLSPYRFPYDLVPILLRATSDGRLYFVASAEGKNAIYFEDAHGLKAVPLPESITREQLGSLKLSVNRYGVCFCKSNDLYIRDEDKWLKVEIPLVKRGGAPHVMLMGKDDIFFGYHFGERGGALVSFNKSKKEFFKTEQVPRVTVMALDNSGRLWFATSSTFLLESGSCVRMYHNGKLLLMADNHSESRRSGATELTSSDNWDFPPTEFTALAFDKANEIYLGTSGEGVFKSVSGKFKQVSEGPYYGSAGKFYVSDVLPLKQNVLMLIPGKGVYCQKVED